MAGESIIANLKSQGFDELIKNLDATAKGFTQLENTMNEAQKKLASLDKNSQDFKDLTKEVNAATTATKAYSESTDTLKKDLRNTTDEIGKLERALNELEKTGQKNTDVYKSISKEQSNLKAKAGELKGTIGNLNEEIKNSGSDTKNLDKAFRALTTVASGYQVAQSALVLFGGENKKFEQTLLKLNAVMALTQGLQQIQNELSKQDSIFTGLAAKAKIAYASATTTATGAVSAFRVAMVALGIGVFIGLVALLVYNWDRLKDAIFGSTTAMDKFIEAKKKSVKLSDEELSNLEDELKYKKAIGKLDDEGVAQERVNKLVKNTQLRTSLLESETKKLNDLKKLSKEYYEEVTVSGQDGISTSKMVAKASQKQVEEQRKVVLDLIKLNEAGVVSLSESQEKLKKVREKNKPKEEKSEKVKELKDELDKQLELYYKSIFARRELEIKHQQFLKQQIKLEGEQRRLEIRKDYLEQEKRNDDNLKKRLKANQDAQNELGEQNKARIEAELRAEQEAAEKRASILNAIANSISGIGDIASQAISIRSQNELDALEEKKKKGIISEKEYEKEVAKVKNEAAAKQRKVDIAMAIAKVPLVILEALASGGPIVAAIAGVLALAQVAILAASPLPKYAKGVIDLQDSKSPNGVDTVHAMLTKGESVMTVDETKEHKDVLKAIRNKNFNKLFVPMNMVKQADVFANIPTPANMQSPIFIDKDDYSSINDRLDKLANEMGWLSLYTKQGNRDRNNGTSKLITNLKPRYVG